MNKCILLKRDSVQVKQLEKLEALVEILQYDTDIDKIKGVLVRWSVKNKFFDEGKAPNATFQEHITIYSHNIRKVLETLEVRRTDAEYAVVICEDVPENALYSEYMDDLIDVDSFAVERLILEVCNDVF